MATYSGLQRSVFALYRKCLRATRTKPAANQENFRRFIRREFRNGATAVDRREFGAVEHLVRRGERQLELYSSQSITNIAG